MAVPIAMMFAIAGSLPFSGWAMPAFISVPMLARLLGRNTLVRQDVASHCRGCRMIG